MSASRFRGIPDSCGEDTEKWEEGGGIRRAPRALSVCKHSLKNSMELWTAAVGGRECLFTVR